MSVDRHLCNNSSSTWEAELEGHAHFPGHPGGRRTLHPGDVVSVKYTTDNGDYGSVFLRGKRHTCKGRGRVTLTRGDDHRVSFKFGVGGPSRHTQAIFLTEDDRQLDSHEFRGECVALNRMKSQPHRGGKEVLGDVVMLDA